MTWDPTLLSWNSPTSGCGRASTSWPSRRTAGRAGLRIRLRHRPPCPRHGQRWPDRAIIAIDKSEEMLAAAAAEPAPMRWVEADIAPWSAPEPAALVYSTATLQWLDGHERLFPHLLGQLVPDGVLAVQMPRNFDAPSHVLMREIAASGPWAERWPRSIGGARVLGARAGRPPAGITTCWRHWHAAASISGRPSICTCSMAPTRC